jgi:cell division protein FtsA
MARSQVPPPVQFELAGALDLGSHKITCIIGKAWENELTEICSFATEPSRGIEHGEITDLDEASEAVGAAIRKAQAAAGFECRRYFIGLASKRCQGLKSRASAILSRENQEITRRDVLQAIKAARKIMLPTDRQIIDSVPQSFGVDDSAGLRNPVGMTGSRLEAEIYLATDSVSVVRNVATCMQKIGCKGEAILFKPFATAEAVLTADEKQLGTVQIDIGEGTTSVAVYYAGSPRFTKVLPIGGGSIARDVAVGLSTTISGARELIHSRGVACDTLIGAMEAKQMLDVPTPDSNVPHKCTLGKLCYIIECRVEEMFEIVKKEIQKAGCANYSAAGVVLSGGAAQLKGIAAKAEQVFDTGARIGRPKSFTTHPVLGENPAYATPVGLLVYGLRVRELIEKEQLHPLFGAVLKIYNRIREYF